MLVVAMNFIVFLSSLASPERVLVRIDSKYFRPTEVELLIGNPAKAKAKLGWTPKIGMKQLCQAPRRPLPDATAC